MGIRPITRSHRLRTTLGFCLIGFANTLLPFLIFSAAYLIIPYPRPVVILIQTLPSLAIKLLLPHLLYDYIPYWARPLVLAFGWTSTSIAAYFTPPNVTPALRVLTVFLASIISAGGDICWLGLLRYYGRHGLQGWGLGTGFGAAICSVLPYFLTVSLGGVLRSGIKYAYYLVPLMLLSHWFVLPAPSSTPSDSIPYYLAVQKGREDDDDIELEHDDNEPTQLSNRLLMQDAPARPLTFPQRLEANLKLMGKLVSPYIVPLAIASAGQAITYPGFSRAMATSTQSFDRYSSYLAAYGLAFQLGNLLGRSMLINHRSYKRRLMLTVTGLLSGLVLANSVFVFEGAPLVVFPIVFAVGQTTGLVWVETFAAALEDRMYQSGSDLEFGLAVMGVGEQVGGVMGGLMGSSLEVVLCGMRLGFGARWCHTTR